MCVHEGLFPRRIFHLAIFGGGKLCLVIVNDDGDGGDGSSEKSSLFGLIISLLCLNLLL